jgi:hypothetical protein
MVPAAEGLREMEKLRHALVPHSLEDLTHILLEAVFMLEERRDEKSTLTD